MATSKPSSERLQVILKRQGEAKFGKDYQPAIRATREEAPSKSRPSTNYSKKLGRDIHALSTGERAFILLAMYCPDLIDIHEQKMLSMDPTPHPFATHPLMAGMDLPFLRGTIEVADELGYISFHPRISVQIDKNEREIVPYPFIGDLLLLMVDKFGAYCVNWDIKEKHTNFSTPFRDLQEYKNPTRAQKRAIARHKIEEVYYLDINIRTVQVAKEDLDKQLIANLRHLFLWHARDGIDNNEIVEITVQALIDGMDDNIPPIRTLKRLESKYAGSSDKYKATFYHAIWQRKLRVNLYRPILIDRPLQSEVSDVMTDLKHLFSRDAP